jgi:nucleotide-binding universal stress UspA family protein
LKIEQIAEENTKNNNISTSAIIRIGNIFEDIGDTAVELGAKLIIMGTHGAKGMQKLVGSHALKVITNSETPFIVVQEKNPKSTGYNNIVLPLDLEKESKQKLKYVADIASYFESKIHIFVQKSNDKDSMNEIKRNLVFAKNYFMEHNVSFTTHVDEAGGDLEDELVRYAAKVDADLICIMNEKDSFISSFLLGSSVQELITNQAEIPVMTVNPKDIGSSAGMGLFS